MIVPVLLVLIAFSAVAATFLVPDLTDFQLPTALAALASVIVLVMALVRHRHSSALTILVDGSNVMHWRDGTPQLTTLREVLTELTDRGFRPGIIFDANAGYKLAGGYRHHSAMGVMLGLPEARVMVVPKGESADKTILTAARDMRARIVTNDRYRDWADAYPEVKEPGRMIRGGYRDGRLWLDLD